MTTSEVAAYLRLKERTVYEMASRRQIPCSRATGKLLFSRRLVAAWVEARTETPEGATSRPPPIYAGSSDPLLEWAIRQSGCGLAVLANGSSNGLRAIARGEATLAGAHLLDPETGDYNLARIRALAPLGDVVAIHWARRAQGLIVAPGNPFGLTGLADAARRRLRFVLRDASAGSGALLDALLAREGLDRDALDVGGRVAETEGDLAGMIAMGEADCGLGAQAAAGALAFVVLWPEERFDLVMRRRDYFEPPVQTLLGFARGPDFARRAAALGGYDLAELGAVRYNA